MQESIRLRRRFGNDLHGSKIAARLPNCYKAGRAVRLNTRQNANRHYLESELPIIGNHVLRPRSLPLEIRHLYLSDNFSAEVRDKRYRKALYKQLWFFKCRRRKRPLYRERKWREITRLESNTRNSLGILIKYRKPYTA